MSLKRFLLPVLIVGGITFFSGCASVTTLQTAETNDPGEVTWYAAYVPTTAPEIIDFDTNGVFDPLMYKTVELGGRVGLTQRLDLGGKIYPVGGLLDVKYNFLDKGMFKAAGDLGVGYMTLSSESVDSVEHKLHVLDVAPMVLFSLRPFRWFSFTAAPKFLMRFQIPDEGDTDLNFLGGGTVTAKFHVGDIGAIMTEFGWFGGSYQQNHFALAAEKNISFGKN